ncbi:MAG: hypothetical protein BWK80_14175 [Desulfobacteraceae bacterium IS3]|nr:MAG: hypothetical protein BWK80_14175 [Desulfobacteraceae bacterium IS3]
MPSKVKICMPDSGRKRDRFGSRKFMYVKAVNSSPVNTFSTPLISLSFYFIKLGKTKRKEKRKWLELRIIRNKGGSLFMISLV